MGVSHALSEKALKKLGLDLDKIEKPDPIKSKEVLQEWNSSKEYWEWQTNKWKEESENGNFKEKLEDFWKYHIAWPLRDWWYDTKWFFSNLKTFYPILKSWRSFDYHYQVDLFKFGIEQLAKALDYYGNEVKESRDKRIKAMNELIKEIDRDFEEDVKNRLNYEYMDSGKVTLYADDSVCFHGDETKDQKKKTEQYYKEVAKERKKHYQRIFDLIIGQDNDKLQKEYNKRIEALTPEEKALPENELQDLQHKIWNEIWDGSGIEGWWD